MRVHRLQTRHFKFNVRRKESGRGSGYERKKGTLSLKKNSMILIVTIGWPFSMKRRGKFMKGAGIRMRGGDTGQAFVCMVTEPYTRVDGRWEGNMGKDSS